MTGKTPVLFRPPYAALSKATAEAAKETSMSVVGVNVFINDPMLFSGQDIYRALLSSVKPGNNIIVLHDGLASFKSPDRSFIAPVLERIIFRLKRNGYSFGRIDSTGKCTLS